MVPMIAPLRPASGDVLCGSSLFEARRSGRYLVVELLAPHRVLSTSAVGGGQRDDVRFLVNHQSCEAQGDQERYELISRMGLDAYHRTVCEEIGIDPERTRPDGHCREHGIRRPPLGGIRGFARRRVHDRRRLGQRRAGGRSRRLGGDRRRLAQGLALRRDDQHHPAVGLSRSRRLPTPVPSSR